MAPQKKTLKNVKLKATGEAKHQQWHYHSPSVKWLWCWGFFTCNWNHIHVLITRKLAQGNNRCSYEITRQSTHRGADWGGYMTYEEIIKKSTRRLRFIKLCVCKIKPNIQVKFKTLGPRHKYQTNQGAQSWRLLYLWVKMWAVECGWISLGHAHSVTVGSLLLHCGLKTKHTLRLSHMFLSSRSCAFLRPANIVSFVSKIYSRLPIRTNTAKIRRGVMQERGECLIL